MKSRKKHPAQPLLSAFSAGLLLVLLIAAAATALWVRSSRQATQNTVSDLGRFYLEEITERNVGSITSEIDRKAQQMELALTLLDQDSLQTASEIAEKSVHTNLGGNPSFNNHYMEQMLFPEAEW